MRVLAVRCTMLQGRYPKEKVGGGAGDDNRHQHCFAARRVCEPRWQEGLRLGRGKERGGSRLMPCPCHSFCHSTPALYYLLVDARPALWPQDCRALISGLRLQEGHCMPTPSCTGRGHVQYLRPNPFATGLQGADPGAALARQQLHAFMPPAPSPLLLSSCALTRPTSTPSPRRTARS